MSIFMSKFAGDDYSAMQGPCPDGFHVPLTAEWTTLIGILTTTFGLTGKGNDMKTYLKMPFAGRRQFTDASISNQGAGGYYWPSTAYPNSSENSRFLYFDASFLNETNGTTRSYALSIRGFKDAPVTPDSSWTTLYQGTGSAGVFRSSSLGLISVSGDGTTWYTIMDKNLGATQVYNDGDTLSEANCGKYYQWGNNYGFPRTGSVTTSSTQVDASNYGPGNYYNSSTFIIRTVSPYTWDSSNNNDLRGGVTGVVQNTGEPKKIYIRVEAQPITTSGIYHNSDLGLISLSSDGSNWITIADKNLGATQVYNDGDTLSEANAGKYYQWGNNYGFAWTGGITTSSTKVNASSYGPGNYYSSSTFITPSSSPYDRSSVQNDNLWGNTTDTNEARRGPCDSGFHIPSNDENIDLVNIMTSLGLDTSNGECLKNYLKMAFGGGRLFTTSNVANQGTYGGYWSSTPNSVYQAYSMSFSSSTLDVNAWNGARPNGQSIRPFYNTAVQPDDSRTKLY